jgi:hypothetical protein
MKPGFCSSGAHDHPDLLTDPWILHAWWRAGHAEERGGCLAGLGAGRHADFGEPFFQEAQGAAHGVGPTGRGLQAHDPLGGRGAGLAGAACAGSRLGL